MTKTITFQDIADYTGFSKTTISRYFNKPDSLTQSTRDIIQRALQELNYKENKLAKVLASGQSEFIGIIIPNTYMDYYSEILDLILSSHDQNHYKFLIFQGRRDARMEMEYINELMSYQIQGLIVLSHTLSSQILSDLHLPVVVLEREKEHVSGVAVNNYKGGELAARHLISIGSTRLIHINSKPSAGNPVYKRIEGFKEEAGRHGMIPEFYFSRFGDSHTSAVGEMRRLFEQIEQTRKPGEVLGIFLSNDTYANMFLNLIVQKYKYLPSYYKIIGFDNTKASYEAIYPITTIAQPKEQMVSEALRLLDEQIQWYSKNSQVRLRKSLALEVQKVECEPYLIVRETTRSNT